MATVRRRGEGTSFDGRAPRLVFRFAILTALSLGAAAAALTLLTRHLYTVDAERGAARHAQFVATSTLGHELRASDFVEHPSEQRRLWLDRVFRERILVAGTLRVALARPDGTIVYATDHVRIGQRVSSPERVADALAGTITSGMREIRTGAPAASVEALESYVPVVVGGKPAGVAVIFQDYAPIAAAAQAAFLPVAGIIQGVVLVLFMLLVPMLARATSRLRRQMQQLEHVAYHDDLTDLPNRQMFLKETQHAIGDGTDEQVGVILLDLDRFKDVNDTLGHGVGDALLRELAHRLQHVLPANAVLARLGGDEFVVVIGGTAEAIHELAARLREQVSVPLVLEKSTVAVEASVGIALFPDHGVDPEALLRMADVALYLAKAERAGIAVYAPERDTNDVARLNLMTELTNAFQQNEIMLHYQAKIDLRTGRLVGVEGLARWQHPTRGLLLPDEFVPFIELTGLRESLTRRIVECAVTQVGAWRSLGLEVPVAANLTMTDLLDLGLPDRIETTLDVAGVPPQLLELEVTESAFMTDPDRVHHVLARLRELGVKVAIDDFGTGYSSLSYLRDLPADAVKLDRSFAVDLEDAQKRQIARAVTDLAHGLGLTVVAEGIETETTLRIVRELGCDIGQGYHLGRPATADEMTARLQARTTTPTTSEVNAANRPRRQNARASENSISKPTRSHPSLSEA